VVGRVHQTVQRDRLHSSLADGTTNADYLVSLRGTIWPLRASEHPAIIRLLSSRPNLGRLAFEGEQVTPTHGENYATHAPLAAVHLRSCASRDSAFSADRFSNTISNSIEHDFARCKQYQTKRGQSELHEQWNLREQQRPDCSET
jgi:hypothetical protein